MWDWHFKYLPQLRRRVGVRNRLLFGTVRGLDKLQRALPPKVSWETYCQSAFCGMRYLR